MRPGVAWLIFVLAGLLELGRLVVHLGHLYGTGINGDAVYYFGMGRGLLNGLRMYPDLFETKPPIIFWLSALSLAVGEDERLYLAIQALLVVILPLVLCWVVLRTEPSSRRRFISAALAFLGGAAVASFVADRSQGFQTEGFGVLPAAVPALVLAWSQRRGFRVWSVWLAGPALAIAVLLKEPFLVAGIAALGWLAQSRRDVFWITQVVAVAGGIGLATLFATGTAGDYFGIYLPEILNGRLFDNLVYHDYRIDQFVQIPTSGALRGVELARLFLDVYPKTPFRLLGVALTLLVLGRPWWFNRSRWYWRLAATAAILSLFLLAQKSFEMRQVVVLIGQMGKTLPWRDQFLLGKIIELGIVATVGLFSFAALSWMRQWRWVGEVIRTLAVLYVATLTASLAGDSPAHHFLFPVPVYLAVIADASIRWSRQESGRMGTVLVAITILCLAAGTVGSRYDYDRLRVEQAAYVRELAGWHASAMQLDVLLDACGEDRYVLADHRVQLLQALTGHSPVQLTYGMARAFDDRQHRGYRARMAKPVFQAKMAQDLVKHRVVVFGSGPGRVLTVPGIEDGLRANDSIVPDCARPFLPIDGLAVTFQQIEP